METLIAIKISEEHTGSDASRNYFVVLDRSGVHIVCVLSDQDSLGPYLAPFDAEQCRTTETALAAHGIPRRGGAPEVRIEGRTARLLIELHDAASEMKIPERDPHSRPGFLFAILVGGTDEVGALVVVSVDDEDDCRFSLYYARERGAEHIASLAHMPSEDQDGLLQMIAGSGLPPTSEFPDVHLVGSVADVFAACTVAIHGSAMDVMDSSVDADDATNNETPEVDLDLN